MVTPYIKKLDLVFARLCLLCPACRRARERREGAVFWVVRYLESGICPFCRAYEKVYGRRAHEPVPQK